MIHNMETDVKLYSLGYSEIRTYMLSALFVVANIILPQVFHLIPQGGIIFAPLSLVILVGAYKFGWRAALLAAVASPLVNHMLFGMPTGTMLYATMLKLVVLALVAGFVAQRFQQVSLLLLCAVVLAAQLLGGLGEYLLSGGIAITLADFTIGYPGLLMQVLGGYLLMKHI